MVTVHRLVVGTPAQRFEPVGHRGPKRGAWGDEFVGTSGSLVAGAAGGGEEVGNAGDRRGVGFGEPGEGAAGLGSEGRRVDGASSQHLGCGLRGEVGLEGLALLLGSGSDRGAHRVTASMRRG